MFDGNNVWLYPKQLHFLSFLVLYFIIGASVLHHCCLLENRSHTIDYITLFTLGFKFKDTEVLSFLKYSASVCV